MLHGVVAGKSVDHRHEQQQGHETADVGKEHAVGGEHVSLLRVGTHHAQQRGIGHVDGRVDHHHQRIGDVGIDDLAREAEVGCDEGEEADQAEGNGQIEQVGTEFTPTAVRAVGHDAHDGVEGGIPDTGDQEHGAHHGSGETKNVGIEDHQVRAEEFPEHGRGHIAKTVTDLFFKFYHGKKI